MCHILVICYTMLLFCEYAFVKDMKSHVNIHLFLTVISILNLLPCEHIYPGVA
jgi:hypothetical protein